MRVDHERGVTSSLRFFSTAEPQYCGISGNKFVSRVKKFVVSSTLRPQVFTGKYSKAANPRKIREKHKILKKKGVSLRACYRLMLRPACQTGLR
jgi:hypothetical protein